jgi:transposase-like protein
MGFTSKGIGFSQIRLREARYLNNVIEADHRFVKRKVRYKQ